MKKITKNYLLKYLYNNIIKGIYISIILLLKFLKTCFSSVWENPIWEERNLKWDLCLISLSFHTKL